MAGVSALAHAARMLSEAAPVAVEAPAAASASGGFDVSGYVEKATDFAQGLPEMAEDLPAKATAWAQGLPDQATEFAQELPDKATAFVQSLPDKAVIAKEKFDAIDFCSVSSSINTIIEDLTVALGGVQYEKMHEHMFAATAAATTLMLVGGALLLAPVIFGRDWMTPVKVILAFFFGLVGSGMLLQKVTRVRKLSTVTTHFSTAFLTAFL